MEEKICPLLSEVLFEKSGGWIMRKFDAPCRGEECAWWDKTLKRCGAVVPF